MTVLSSVEAMERADELVTSDPADVRLVLASNREPFQISRNRHGEIRDCIQSMGGLTSALCPVLQRRDGLWVCWNPEPDKPVSQPIEERNDEELPFPLVQIGLRETEVQGYYNGFCNRVLWPLCHTILRCVTPRLDYWQEYSTVNDRFADTIAGQVRPSDVVWVHDYHLMLVPAALRRRIGAEQRIGYFHHTPFPCAPVLKALPWHRQVLKGLLGANTIGFHTSEYAANFIECCRELLGCDTESEPGTVIHGKYRTTVRVRPIGIDTQSFAQLASDPKVQDAARALREELPCERLVLSVDRLDYTKGLLERIDGIRAFFSRLPQCRGVVTFLQIAVPTRTDVPEYQQYRTRLEDAVEALNREFGCDDWVPLEYRTEPLEQPGLVSHYLAADVACVTPVADGMNLVAMEYCASRPDGDGALILSQQAGAHSLLGEYALTIDIRDPESFLTGMVQALSMSAPERQYRMGKLREITARNDTASWLRKCLRDIATPPAEETRERRERKSANGRNRRGNGSRAAVSAMGPARDSLAGRDADADRREDLPQSDLRH